MKKRKLIGLAVLILAAMVSGCTSQADEPVVVTSVLESSAQSSEEESIAESAGESSAESSTEQSSKVESGSSEASEKSAVESSKQGSSKKAEASQKTSAAEKKTSTVVEKKVVTIYQTSTQPQQSVKPETTTSQESSVGEYHTGYVSDTSAAFASDSTPSLPTNLTGDWREQYVQVAEYYQQNNQSATIGMENWTYELMDLDGDGIPEMVITMGEFHVGTCCTVYSFTSGELKILDIKPSFGVILYNPELKKCAYNDGYFGVRMMKIYDIVKGEAQEVLDAYAIPKPVQGQEETYKLDGRKVSKEEYDQAIAPYMSDYYYMKPEWIKVGRKNAFSVDSIKNAVNAWQ